MSQQLSDHRTAALPLLHSLGGCGGTLVAKCLASMPAVVLLSETNPASALLFDYSLNPVTQVRSWYPELYADLNVQLEPADLAGKAEFREFIVAVYAAATARGERLIVRDYNYVDYFGVPFTPVPARSSSLLAALGDTFRCTSAVMVRHPLRQYDSLRSHRSAGPALQPKIFLEGYAAFLADFEAAYVFKYEDVIEEPVASIANLCAYLDLPYAEDFLDRFPEYRSVTGNLARQADPTISHAVWEPETDEWRAELLRDPQYHELLEKLGYDDEAGRRPGLHATRANTPERLAAALEARDAEIQRLRSTSNLALDEITVLRSELAAAARGNERLRPIADESNERERLLKRNDEAQQQLFEALAERERQIAALTAALEEIQVALEAERTASIERLELLEIASRENERLRPLFEDLTDREARIAELSTALDEARAGWVAASNEAELLRESLEAERVAAIERASIIDSLMNAVEKQ